MKQATIRETKEPQNLLVTWTCCGRIFIRWELYFYWTSVAKACPSPVVLLICVLELVSQGLSLSCSFMMSKCSEQFSVREVNPQIPDNKESVSSSKKLIRELIGTDHTAESNKKSILEICEDFQTFFIWKGVNCRTLT
jgi:hypothetical protein